MADITLTSTTRANLLSLQQTTDLANRTQGRLSTGLKVANAIDDAVAYFQSKNLNDRAADFTDRKTEIDQGISSLKSALNVTEAADKVLKQLKGIVISARTADGTTRADLTAQFNDLATQLNSLLDDATYQGTNLVNATAGSLTVRFSNSTASQLVVAGRDLRISGLLNLNSGAGGNLSAALLGVSGAGLNAGFSDLSDIGSAGVFSSQQAAFASLDALADQLDGAVNTVRAAASSLGANVTFLQTRLDFSKSYINTLTEGADKLSLADLNEEGANLVALQTRQQLALQALNFAGQSNQQVLSLFK